MKSETKIVITIIFVGICSFIMGLCVGVVYEKGTILDGKPGKEWKDKIKPTIEPTIDIKSNQIKPTKLKMPTNK